LTLTRATSTTTLTGSVALTLPRRPAALTLAGTALPAEPRALT
jgi:hypothetical protein